MITMKVKRKSTLEREAAEKITGKRACQKCLKKKSLSEFGKQGDGLQVWCKKCMNAFQRNWNKDHPDYYSTRKSRNQFYFRDQKLMKVYGLTRLDYEEILKRQNSSCAICRSASQKLVVDHDHLTGRVRGLLCRRCNTRLGYVEMTDWASSAMKYLDLYRRSSPVVESATTQPPCE